MATIGNLAIKISASADDAIETLETVNKNLRNLPKSGKIASASINEFSKNNTSASIASTLLAANVARISLATGNMAASTIDVNSTLRSLTKNTVDANQIGGIFKQQIFSAVGQLSDYAAAFGLTDKSLVGFSANLDLASGRTKPLQAITRGLIGTYDRFTISIKSVIGDSKILNTALSVVTATESIIFRLGDVFAKLSKGAQFLGKVLIKNRVAIAQFITKQVISRVVSFTKVISKLTGIFFVVDGFFRLVSAAIKENEGNFGTIIKTILRVSAAFALTAASVSLFGFGFAGLSTALAAPVAIIGSIPGVLKLLGGALSASLNPTNRLKTAIINFGVSISNLGFSIQQLGLFNAIKLQFGKLVGVIGRGINFITKRGAFLQRFFQKLKGIELPEKRFRSSVQAIGKGLDFVRVRINRFALFLIKAGRKIRVSASEIAGIIIFPQSKFRNAFRGIAKVFDPITSRIKRLGVAFAKFFAIPGIEKFRTTIRGLSGVLTVIGGAIFAVGKTFFGLTGIVLKTAASMAGFAGKLAIGVVGVFNSLPVLVRLGVVLGAIAGGAGLLGPVFTALGPLFPSIATGAFKLSAALAKGIPFVLGFVKSIPILGPALTIVGSAFTTSAAAIGTFIGKTFLGQAATLALGKTIGFLSAKLGISKVAVAFLGAALAKTAKQVTVFFAKVLGFATKSLAKLTGGLISASVKMALFGTIALGIGAILVKKFLLPIVKSFADIARDSRKLGISTEELSKLQFAATEVGLEADTVTKSLSNMNKTIGSTATFGRGATEALGRLGLNANELSGLLPEEQFKSLVGALSEVKNQTERTALATKIFGSEAEKLAPLLKGGTKGLEDAANEAQRLGFVISGIDAEAIEKADNAMKQVGKSIKGAGVQLAIAFAPIIVDVAQDIVRLATKVKDFAAKTIIFVRFASENFSALFKVAFDIVTLEFTRLRNIVVFFFTDTIPTVLDFFLENWKNIFLDIGDIAFTVFRNLTSNLFEVIKNIPALIKGEGKAFDEMWAPLLEGFERRTKEFPGFATRALSETERILQQSIDDQVDILGRKLFEVSQRAAKTRRDITKALPDEIAPPEAEREPSAVEAIEKGTAKAFETIVALRKDPTERNRNRNIQDTADNTEDTARATLGILQVINKQSTIGVATIGT